MAFNFYIYYRVDPQKAGACAPVIQQLFAAVRDATGIRGRLLRKCGEPNLWMEVYEGVADEAKFEWDLAEIAGRFKVQDHLQPGTTRHVECFES
ncbi:MAG: DUF4936 family protein [Burkholderiales bacterium]